MEFELTKVCIWNERNQRRMKYKPCLTLATPSPTMNWKPSEKRSTTFKNDCSTNIFNTSDWQPSSWWNTYNNAKSLLLVSRLFSSWQYRAHSPLPPLNITHLYLFDGIENVCYRAIVCSPFLSSLVRTGWEIWHPQTRLFSALCPSFLFPATRHGGVSINYSRRPSFPSLR